jgi:hemolysin activation/secretion protein
MESQTNSSGRLLIARTSRLSRAAIALALPALLCLGRPAAAQEDPPAPAEAAETVTPAAANEPVFPLGALHFRYLRENPLHPPLEPVMQLAVSLGHLESGFVAPREGVPAVTIILGDIGRGGVQAFHASAIQRILETVRDHFVAQDLLGVYVAPDPMQINEFGEDLREDDQVDLTIIITTGIVTELRTVASGERVEKGEIEPAERIDHPLHARHLERSPIRPHREGDAERLDLLRKGELDRYLFHLGRHPGRRVDATVAAAEEIGGIALDYMITENRPLVLYAQVSNTGTRSTDYWRERFGLLHTQLTNNDDILSLDYSTAQFDDVHAVAASYEAPFPNDRIRWRVQGTWSEYTASELGVFADIFRGDSWSIGGEIIANVYQDRELFLDLLGGVRFEDIHVERDIFGGIFFDEGDQDFVFPYVGLRLDRTTEWFSTQGTATLEFQSSDLSDVDESELNQLGRTVPDEDWVVLRWNLSHSVFLEPLLDREAWEDPSTPQTSTLAHELALSFRGQYAFDNRLIPQVEQVLGGLYTVRGYPESVIAGDTALIGSIEYRYHLPRAFKIEPEPREMFGEPFRTAPQYVYGHPDWDLVLKGFLDIGHSIISEPFSFEDDETLIGAGIGIELLYRRNLNVRLDWGFALEDLDGRDVNSGSNRLHLVATILF